MKLSPVSITCPKCLASFRIELAKAQAIINALEKENQALRVKVASADVMQKYGSLSDIFGSLLGGAVMIEGGSRV